MNENIKLIINGVFLGLAIMMGLRVFRTKGRIKITDEQPKLVLYLIIALVVLMVLSTIFTYKSNTINDYIRLVLTIVLIVLFYMFHDGIGDEGLSSSGIFYIWDDIKNWDYATKDKGTSIFFTLNNQKPDKNGQVLPRYITFPNTKSKEVVDIIKGAIPKKYKRMRKSS